MSVPNSDPRRKDRWPLVLAVVTGCLPIIAVNLSYLLAIRFDALPACMPYFEGCTSISSTGRVYPSEWVFKSLMAISAISMAWFFFTAGHQTAARQIRIEWLAVCGLAGSLALLLYLLFLGSEGPAYRLLRRYGVSLYFGFVLLGQLLLAHRLLSNRYSAPAYALSYVCALLLGLGLLSIPITNFVADKDQIENIIEWLFALLLHLNFLLAGAALTRKVSDPKTT